MFNTDPTKQTKNKKKTDEHKCSWNDKHFLFLIGHIQ